MTFNAQDMEQLKAARLMTAKKKALGTERGRRIQ